jgi:hypothetical protein
MLVFWAVTPCGLAGRYTLFKAEDGDSMFLRNVGYLSTSPNGATTQKTSPP